jgi:SAM-dependent methyltransferase
VTPGAEPFPGVSTPAEAQEAAERVRAVLPAALAPAFDGTFIRSGELYDEFVLRLAVQVARRVGLDTAAAQAGSVDELAARARLHPDRARVALGWILRRLAARGLLELSPGTPPRYRATDPLPALDPSPVRAEQARVDPAWLPAYTLAETVASEYPAFLRGQRTGEEILFSAARLRLWVDFFSNDHRLYAVNNLVGAVAVETWCPPGPVRILELGGGLGSAAQALLRRLRDAGRWGELRRYHFTELVPAFLRRARERLAAEFPDAPGLTFGVLDMNRSFEAQGIEPGAWSVTYAVNTLHVARDLAFTLREVHHALAPGGRLVISECVRPTPGTPIYVEFVFHLMETFRAPVLHPVWRPNGGFLTPEQWRGAMEAAGFEDVSFLPDVPAIRDRFPTFYVAAVGARRPG